MVIRESGEEVKFNWTGPGRSGREASRKPKAPIEEMQYGVRYRGETRLGKHLRGKEEKLAGCDIGVRRAPESI